MVPIFFCMSALYASLFLASGAVAGAAVPLEDSATGAVAEASPLEAARTAEGAL